MIVDADHKQKTADYSVSFPDESTDETIEYIAKECLRCNACVKECGFLQNNDNPGGIATQYLAGDKTHWQTAYSCSLCSLCVEICPQSLPISEMFLVFRRLAVAHGAGRYKQHLPVMFYEKIGKSSLFSHYYLPDKCNTVLFPGCSLPGIRPKQTMQVFDRLKQEMPTLGLVFDCCGKLSHDLGFQDKFIYDFEKMFARLRASGVNNIITTCPSCFQIFTRYGKDLKISTAYTLLRQSRVEISKATEQLSRLTVHDPCTLRFEDETQQAVRELVDGAGIELVEMNHSRRKTYCCGEGGATDFLKGHINANWTDKRCEEAGNHTMITYCAGCTSKLSRGKTLHLVDLLFRSPEEPIKTTKPVSAPFTYLNRLFVKLKIIYQHLI